MQRRVHYLRLHVRRCMIGNDEACNRMRAKVAFKHRVERAAHQQGQLAHAELQLRLQSNLRQRGADAGAASRRLQALRGLPNGCSIATDRRVQLLQQCLAVHAAVHDQSSFAQTPARSKLHHILGRQRYGRYSESHASRVTVAAQAAVV